jgi:hypothetical protein
VSRHYRKKPISPTTKNKPLHLSPSDTTLLAMKRLIVASLENVCSTLDKTIPWVHWCRWFAAWSVDLDMRWQTGQWTRVPSRPLYWEFEL